MDGARSRRVDGLGKVGAVDGVGKVVVNGVRGS